MTYINNFCLLIYILRTSINILATVETAVSHYQIGDIARYKMNDIRRITRKRVYDN